MQITSTDILKKLPEFDDLLQLAEEISKASLLKLKLERRIKSLEADIILEALGNPAYFSNGKPPSMSLISSTYAYTGFKGELLELRDELALKIAEEAKLKARLDLYKEFLNMWRSLNASERAINA